MNKIVVGFDGSEEGRDGLRLGGSLAESMGAELVVASAFSPRQGAPEADQESVAQGHFRNLFAEAERDLARSDLERRELIDVGAPRG